MIPLAGDQNMGLRPHFNFWQTSRFQLRLTKPMVMGIVNVTPDSFSAVHTTTATPMQALGLAQQHLHDGADILDIGGESTRPGAKALTADQEWVRIQPVLSELITWHKPVSIDTYHPENMHRALDMGVDIVNDIWALRKGDALAVVSAYKCGVCLMHMHDQPATMQLAPMQGDVVQSICQFFQNRLSETDLAGIHRNRLVLDPGVGFGKTVPQNFSLLRNQDVFMRLGLPIMAGWSRKSALGQVTGLDVSDRLVPSIAAALLAVERGSRILRVHDVKATIEALKVWVAVENLTEPME